jgi:adenylyltransferase/sulfurtransferase
MSLTDEENERYHRHLLLKDVGVSGQEKLRNAHVLIVGAGGLGSPLLMYLAAAGVGHIGVVDDDAVSLSNLQRQIVHDTKNIGLKKVESAAQALHRINSHVTIETIPKRLTEENALALIGRFDIVADGSDNFAASYLLNDACYFAKKPLVFAAVGSFDGQLSTFRAFEQAPDGMPRPSYRCIFPTPPPAGSAAHCREIGILGAVPGVMGTLQAMEVLKEILGIGESLVGKLLIYDALQSRFERITIAWDPENPLNGRNPQIKDLSIHKR